MNPRPHRSRWLPGPAWWAPLTLVIGAGLIGNWFIATGATVLVLLHLFRPFDFITAFTIVAAWSTFIYYEGGNMTLQLSLLGAATLAMLVCYLITLRGRLMWVAWTELTPALLTYLFLSTANFGRGLLSGYPIKNVFNEALPVFAIATTFLVANGFHSKRDIGPIVVIMVATAFASSALGYYVFSIIHTHTSGVFFNTIPGLVALLLINLALRSSSPRNALLWAGLALPLFMHQFLSFRRGLWVGCLAGLITSVLVFALRAGQGRWARTGLVVGTLLGAGAFGAITLQVVYGRTDILEASLGRFKSISGTELTPENRSNLDRLVEYAAVTRYIKKSPWIGYGLGYTYVVTDLLSGRTFKRWWVDGNYFLIWLKQGIIGFAAYLWILWSAFWLGARNARQREDPWESSWFATTAAATAFVAAFSFSDWPFDQVNPTFLLALLFGGSMAMASKGYIRIWWRVSRPSAVRSRPEVLVGASTPRPIAGT